MLFRIEAAGTQSLAGALPVHSLSCKTVDDLTILPNAHDLNSAIRKGLPPKKSGSKKMSLGSPNIPTGDVHIAIAELCD